MRSTIITAALSLATTANGLKILMGNDDGFGSGNLRETYKLLKSDGHDVVIVAPATQQSGQGGRSSFTTSPTLTHSSQYSLIPAGSPSLGTDPHDSHIWYYNGTPAACVFVALDYVLPNHYPEWNGAPDLFIAGPNYGANLGPFVYGLSGTLGATYAAISRSVPGIAVSASNDAVPWFNVSGEAHPAKLAARAGYAVVAEYINQTAAGHRILPLGYGVNVNIPELNSTTLPPVVKSRLTGEADTDIAVLDKETGLFRYENAEPKAAGVNACYNGDCGLPGETWVVEGGSIAVSVFTVDYDAPRNRDTEDVFGKVRGLVEGTRGNGKRRRRVRTGRDVLRG